ncbi:MAG: hypothetical protein FWF75_08560 [Propionibacteriaceae bacterium]|nr:hypothetical protein [Propionibacteriaceae bacterium]
MKGLAGALSTVFNVLYLGIALNLCLALTCAPVWILATLVPLRNAWPWLAASSLLLAPALAGAYAVFAAYRLDGSVTVPTTYFKAWARSWRRVWAPGLGLVAYFLVIALDWYVVGRWGHAIAVLPVAVVLVALGLASACVAWIGLTTRPDLTRPDVVRGSIFLAVRHPGRSLVMLAALVILAGAVWLQPVVGLGIVAAPALYVVWTNAQHAFARFSIRPEADPCT